MEDLEEGEGGGEKPGAMRFRGATTGGMIRQLLEGIDDIFERWWDYGVVAAHLWFGWPKAARAPCSSLLLVSLTKRAVL